jgi:SAM-dependent methyltransferase
VGTGDGRAVVARARREPATFVIGLDATASAMAEASRRAARTARRGGLDNVLFVVAGIEQPPGELAGQAHELTILFPWGSLLRGALALDDPAAAGIASLLRPGGRLVALLSIADRDGLDLPDVDATVDAIAERWRRHGLVLERVVPATRDEVAVTGSSWARRLAGDRERPIRRLEFTRPEAAGDAFAIAG